MVSEPTRVSPNSTSTTDLSRPQLIESCRVAPPLGKSDHNSVILNILLPKGSKKKTVPKKTIWLYNRADTNRCKTMLRSLPLAQEDDSIDHHWENWSNQVLNII